MKRFFYDFKTALLGAVFIMVVLFAAGQAQGKTVRWEGTTDYSMLKQVREDIASAKNDKSLCLAGCPTVDLRVDLASPGGPVIMALEIARIVRDASDAGLVVEIHAAAICASGCTFVLASGTPKHRIISAWALFLVHSMQSDGECVKRPVVPRTQEEKANTVLLNLMRDAYVRFTGQPAAEVEQWITCGDERVGTGELAVQMHIADAVE